MLQGINNRETSKLVSGEIKEFEEIRSLDYKIKFEGKHGSTEAYFVSLKIKDINVAIQLNESLRLNF